MQTYVIEVNGFVLRIAARSKSAALAAVAQLGRLPASALREHAWEDVLA